MPDNFKIIYKYLRVLEKAMDYDELDTDLIKPEALGTTKNRLDSIIAMLVNDGYVKGYYIKQYLDQDQLTVFAQKPAITLKGLEYLKENSMMQKAANAAKGIIDIIT